MSCPTGFSQASDLDPTCVRDCAKGDPSIYPLGAYYPEADICWPTCPNLSDDKGAVCTKKIVQRTPIVWQTRPEGDPEWDTDFLRRIVQVGNSADREGVKEERVLTPSNQAGCPPRYSAYISSNDTYPAPNNSKYVVKCFFSCPILAPRPDGSPDPTQTSLSSTGQCKVQICPNNEQGTGQMIPATGANNEYTDMNGSKVKVSQGTVVCKRDTYKTTRTFSLSQCPPGKSAQFISEASTSSNLIYVNEPSLPSTVLRSNTDYKRYFSCTNTCPSGQQRFGNYCMPPCPDAGEMGVLVNNSSNSTNSSYYQKLVFPDDAPGQSRCLIKLDGSSHTYTISGGSLPAQVSADQTCSSGTLVKKWKPAVGTSTAQTTAFAAFQGPTGAQPLFNFDTTPTSNFPENKACIASSVCSAGNYPVGFKEVGNSFTVYCATRAATCEGQQTGFLEDNTFANMCQRVPEFNDSAEEPADYCPNVDTYLYGVGSIIEDATMGKLVTLKENGVGTGWQTEILPNKFTVAYALSVYDPNAEYVYDQVVGTSKDNVKGFLADGRSLPESTEFTLNLPWSPNDPDNPVPIRTNLDFGRVTGPFFRCIKAHTGNGTSNLPPFTPGPVWPDKPLYDQDPTMTPVSNTYWTSVNIPTKVIVQNAKPAGVNKFKETEYCDTSTTNQFCPYMCATWCPGPTSTARKEDPNNPKYGDPSYAKWLNYGAGASRYDLTYPVHDKEEQAGIFEPVYKGTVQGTNFNITDAYCMPRCGSSSGTYAGVADFCTSKASPVVNYVVAGLSWCPDASGDPHATSFNVAPSNPDGSNGLPTNNVCYSPCPPGMMVSNEPPQTTCVTKCPNDARFLDEGGNCVKVPYLRDTVSGNPTEQTTQQSITSIEQTAGGAAFTVSKVVLSGGASGLVNVIIFVALGAFMVSIVLAVLKYHGAKYH